MVHRVRDKRLVAVIAVMLMQESAQAKDLVLARSRQRDSECCGQTGRSNYIAGARERSSKALFPRVVASEEHRERDNRRTAVIVGDR